MGKVGGSMRGLALIVLVMLVVSPAGSHALWSGKKDAEPATAAEAAKEYAKDAVRNTADAAGNAGESLKQTANAAYETTAKAAKTATGGRSDQSSGAPAYRDRAGNYVSDTAAATQQKTAEAAGAVKETAVNGAQAARDTAARAYDATAETLGNAKTKVVGAPEPEPTYTQRAADVARAAKENVLDGSSRAHDAATNSLSAPFAKEDNRGVLEKAKDKLSETGQATRDHSYRAMGYEAPSDKSYASRAYDSISDSSADAYEAGKNRLGSIVEILGWQRAAPEHEASLGKYHSPYDVMVGNTRYVWNKRADEPESYYKSAKNAAGSATQTVAEKANQAAGTVSDVAVKTKDATVDTASRASETVKDAASDLTHDGFLRKVWRFVHLLTWGVAFGTAVWMTFMSGRIMQQNMPREQFRTVQTKMFPSYLRFLTAAESVLAFLYYFLSNSTKLQTFILLLLAAATAYNAFVLEPQTTKIYLDRLRLEKEEGRGIASPGTVSDELNLKNKKFKESHGYSATLNLLSLLGLTYHAWNIASKV